MTESASPAHVIALMMSFVVITVSPFVWSAGFYLTEPMVSATTSQIDLLFYAVYLVQFFGGFAIGVLLPVVFQIVQDFIRPEKVDNNPLEAILNSKEFKDWIGLKRL